MALRLFCLALKDLLMEGEVTSLVVDNDNDSHYILAGIRSGIKID